MTGNGANIWRDDEKSLVEVRRKSAKMLYFQRIYAFVGLFDFRGVKMNRTSCYYQGHSVQDCRL
jgi:hypothetical protein